MHADFFIKLRFKPTKVVQSYPERIRYGATISIIGGFLAPLRPLQARYVADGPNRESAVFVPLVAV
jgi:hypothetical protein